MALSSGCAWWRSLFRAWPCRLLLISHAFWGFDAEQVECVFDDLSDGLDEGESCEREGFIVSDDAVLVVIGVEQSDGILDEIGDTVHLAAFGGGLDDRGESGEVLHEVALFGLREEREVGVMQSAEVDVFFLCVFHDAADAGVRVLDVIDGILV